MASNLPLIHSSTLLRAAMEASQTKDYLEINGSLGEAKVEYWVAEVTANEGAGSTRGR